MTQRIFLFALLFALYAAQPRVRTIQIVHASLLKKNTPCCYNEMLQRKMLQRKIIQNLKISVK